MALVEPVRTDTRWIRRRDWTDVALLVGPNMRWVEDDYPTLIRKRPEELLGYQVHFTTYDRFTREVRGRVVGKVVVLTGSDGPMPVDFLMELDRLRTFGTRISWCYVHGDVVRV